MLDSAVFSGARFYSLGRITQKSLSRASSCKFGALKPGAWQVPENFHIRTLFGHANCSGPFTEMVLKPELSDPGSPPRHTSSHYFEGFRVAVQKFAHTTDIGSPKTAKVAPRTSQRLKKRTRDSEDEAVVVRASPKKPKRGYADPEIYQHLEPLQDYLEEGLDGACGPS